MPAHHPLVHCMLCHLCSADGVHPSPPGHAGLINPAVACGLCLWPLLPKHSTQHTLLSYPHLHHLHLSPLPTTTTTTHLLFPHHYHLLTHPFRRSPYVSPLTPQAMDRAHRIGQKKEVQVFRFCTENSIEEKVRQTGRGLLLLLSPPLLPTFLQQLLPDQG